MRPLKAATDLLLALAAGALTVLLLAASNVDRGVAVSDLGPPFGLALLAAVVCWLVARRITRQRSSQGPLAVLLVFGTLMYGYMASPLEHLIPLGPNASVLVALALITTGGIAFLAFVRRLPPLPPDWRRGVSVALLTMLTVTAIAVLRGFSAAARHAPPEGPSTVGTATPSDSSGRPDILLIVLDAYSRSDHLREIYGFDNSGFERELELRGFQIPARARANYGTTFLAMAALLNWDYVDVLEPRVLEPDAARSLVYNRVEDNRTVRFLKSIGYEFIYLRSSYPAMASNRLADRVLPERVRGQFGQMYASRTILMPIARSYCLFTRCFESSWPFAPEGPAVISEKFRYLEQLSEGGPPRFVVAHFLLPHEPFRLDSGCSPIEPLWPATFDEKEEAEVRLLYPQQVACTNRKVLASVDRILAAAAPDPIILIQADHGYGRLPWGRTGRLTETDLDRARERMAVFAAYRLPGADAPEVPPDISPVNLFRLVLSSYFGREDLVPIENVSWWSAWERPYDFTRLE